MKLTARPLWFALLACASLATAPAHAQRRQRPAPASAASSLVGTWRYESIGATSGDLTFTAAPEAQGLHFESSLQNMNCPACETCVCSNPIVHDAGWYSVTGDRLVLHITERVTVATISRETAVAPQQQPRVAVNETRTYRMERVTRARVVRDWSVLPDATITRNGLSYRLFRVTS